MKTRPCDCDVTSSGKECLTCVNGVLLPYWCETCRKQVAERRCHYCGLKTSKVRKSDQQYIVW